jgi:hypothetical protein
MQRAAWDTTLRSASGSIMSETVELMCNATSTDVTVFRVSRRGGAWSTAVLPTLP